MSDLCRGLLLACFLLFQTSYAQTEDRTLLLATTTSVDNSGLLTHILPVLEKDTGLTCKVIAVGTGRALKLGEAGDVDVLLVHAKGSELVFMQAGYGVDRTPFMFNDFVLVGPKTDPANIAQQESVSAAIKSIAASKALFVSRGDDSGTHEKELRLWHAADIQPGGDWYRQAGQGMGKTLQIADELQAYTLTDRGTWLFNRHKLDLKVVFQGDGSLYNQYSVIAVNPELHQTNYAGAMAFSDWMVSAKGQAMINQYRVHGEQLFHADFGGNIGGTKF